MPPCALLSKLLASHVLGQEQAQLYDCMGVRSNAIAEDWQVNLGKTKRRGFCSLVLVRSVQSCAETLFRAKSRTSVVDSQDKAGLGSRFKI